MTGHLLYGDYDRVILSIAYIHFIIYLSNGKNIELSDACVNLQSYACRN
jgi:hypothetical protein